MALRYSGGAFDRQLFKNCEPPSAYSHGDSGDHLYYYPAGRREFKFSNDPNSDAPPITVTTADKQELTVTGTVIFELNTSCTPFTDAGGRQWPGGIIQKFHEQIGAKPERIAYAEDSSEPQPPGWLAGLGIYLKDPLERTLDAQSLKYNWPDLYSDAAKKTEWEQAALGGLPDLIKQQAGEDYFHVISVLLQKPVISQRLQDQLQAEQEATLRANTEKVEADRRIAAANAERATIEGWPGGQAGYEDYQRTQAEIKCLNENRCALPPGTVILQK